MSNIEAINLSATPIPAVYEDRTKEWVTWGTDNCPEYVDFFQYLIHCRNVSPTNSSIINAEADMIFGNGLELNEGSREQFEALTKALPKKELRRMAADLKQMGQCAMQVIYNQGKTAIAEVVHMPVHLLRPEKMNDDGDIEAYYFASDWSKVRVKEDAERIPAFGFGAKGAKIEILYVRPYRAGSFYYSPVDYQGGLIWADIEGQVGEYHRNNIANGFSATKLINFYNGDPGEEAKQILKAEIERKLAGANGQKMIISFQAPGETGATVDDIPVTDAHNQYEFVSNECMRKLFVAHRVTSPRLLGINEGGGLGNNADEITIALDVFTKTVIRPFQDLLLDALEQVITFNKWDIKVDFIQLHGEVADDKRQENKEQAAPIAQLATLSAEFNDDALFTALDEFGEVIDENEWELWDERPVDYEHEDALDKMLMLTSTGTARPNAKSEQDGKTDDDVYYKVRYAYAPKRNNANSRQFCKKMEAAGKVYRKEDIIQMSSRAVNPGWGPKGASTYDVWLYKGGGDCHHFWMRKTYVRKGQAPGTAGTANLVSANEAKRQGVKLPENDKRVAMLPTDMPNNGFLKPRK